MAEPEALEDDVVGTQSQYGLRADGRDLGITFSDMWHAKSNLDILGLSGHYNKELAIFDRMIAKVVRRLLRQT